MASELESSLKSWNRGNVATLANIRPSFGLEVFFGSIVGRCTAHPSSVFSLTRMVVAIVESMFLRRIYVMSKQSLILTVPLALLIGVQLAFGIIGAHFGLTPQPFVTAVGGPFASVGPHSA